MHVCVHVCEHVCMCACMGACMGVCVYAVLSSTMLPVSLAILPITVLSPVATTTPVQVPMITIIMPDLCVSSASMLVYLQQH